MQLTVQEVLDAVNGVLLFGNTSDKLEYVSKNSGENIEGRVFIPLKAKRDGHEFIADAVSNGAIGYFTENDEIISCRFAIKVSDTKKALGDLAKYVLSKAKAKVIAITGSVAKTTTRQYIAGVLAEIGKTAASIENFNNDIGLPLSVLEMDGDEDFIVLEMGMNNLGEISYLSNIAKPDIAVITLIGTSHIGNLGSRENILKAKLEILDGLKENGLLILNGDDPILCSLKEKYNPKYYGSPILTVIKDSPNGEFIIDGERFHIASDGIHNITNASCAVLIGKMLGGTPEQIRKGLKRFRQEKYRNEVYEISGKTMIVDCYNSSLESVKANLSSLKKRDAKRKVAILGSIGEADGHLEEILKNVGKAVFENKIDLLICVDENANLIIESAIEAGMQKESTIYFKTKESLYKEINNILKEGDTILIKASRSYKFEEIADFLKCH